MEMFPLAFLLATLGFRTGDLKQFNGGRGKDGDASGQ